MTVADELVDLVDADDRVVEVVSRAEMRARGAAARHRACYVAVLTSAGELVVHRRADWKEVHPGYWDICFGGVLGAGEAWVDAARRELAEEAGVDAEPVLLGTASWSAEDTNLNARIYLARSDGPFTCPDGEVVEVATVPLAELDEWLAGRDVCPDSVELVRPRLPR
ncbi:MAG TPA: NUDIX domain-containing protein [Acidimicrobiales bacterium]|nr:NUDIX domain-containing protein [Acidimicrobiales bacterium]